MESIFLAKYTLMMKYYELVFLCSCGFVDAYHQLRYFEVYVDTDNIGINRFPVDLMLIGYLFFQKRLNAF